MTQIEEAMDAAQNVGLAVANHKHLRQLVTYFKGRRALARAACHEADANCPVPLHMSQAMCEAVIRQAKHRHPPRHHEKRQQKDLW